MTVQVIDNVFTEDFNEMVIDSLLGVAGWEIHHDFDHFDHDKKADIDRNVYSDGGMVLRSSHRQDCDHINKIAETIFFKICDLQGIDKNVKVIRYLWNYYNRSSTGSFHMDIKEDNHRSIVYHLDSSGQTEVGDEIIPGQSGRAILFDSNTIHRGVGPTESPFRMCLNVLYKNLD